MLKAIFSNLDYLEDKALMKEYAGVDLTPETFASYADKFTLAELLGNSAKRERDYHGFGTPREIGNADILCTILRRLDRENIHLEFGPNTQLGNKVVQLMPAHFSANRWFSLPDHYLPKVAVTERMRQTYLWLSGSAFPNQQNLPLGRNDNE